MGRRSRPRLGFSFDLIGNLTNKLLLHLLPRSAVAEVVPTVIGMRSKLNPIYPRIIPFSPRTSVSMVHRKSFVKIQEHTIDFQSMPQLFLT
jgi:hypothetical protein